MDDPFRGIEPADAEQILEAQVLATYVSLCACTRSACQVLEGPLFAGRSCIVNFDHSTAQLAIASQGLFQSVACLSLL